MSAREPWDEAADWLVLYRDLGVTEIAGRVPEPAPALEDSAAMEADAEGEAEEAAARATSPVSDEPPLPAPAPARDPAEAEAALAQLRDVELGDCQRCGLAKTRNKIVFGGGSATARLMFVGEAPGADEDRQGEPFVGRAGQLLDRIIAAMGLSRSEVYIGNVIKCRPPDNRTPLPDERGACLPFLEEQVRIIQPEAIVALGRTALEGLLGHEVRSISRARGQWFLFESIPVLATYHPAYLLRTPEAKRPVWEDMQQVMERLGLEPPQRPRS